MRWSRSLGLLPSVVAAAALLPHPALATASQVTPHVSAPVSFASMVKPLIPAVVNISTKTKTGHRSKYSQDDTLSPEGSPFEELFQDFFERIQPEGPRQSSAVGSGFIVDPSGYIVTNNHLVSDADQITVLLNDGTELPAKLVGHDRRTDIAVLKVETSQELPFVQWDASDGLQVGDWIIAIGNPFGLGGTVTSGIVSHRERNIEGRLGQPSASDFVDGYIQTDASINLGNSGGPMFDMKGKVVGVNTAIFSPTGVNVGIGFAIPADIAQKVVRQIIKYGRTKRGWLGVKIQMITDDIAENLGLSSTAGALIGSITPQGPAANSKLQTGDVILKVAGKTVKRYQDLPRMIGNQPVGKSVPLSVWRKGKIHQLNVKVGEYEKAEGVTSISSDEPQALPRPQGVESQGLTLQTLTPQSRKVFDLTTNTSGVLIVEVDPNSHAAERGIRARDIIVEISQEDVHSPKDVVNKIRAATKDGRKSILLLVNRDGEVRYVAVQLAAEGQKS